MHSRADAIEGRVDSSRYASRYTIMAAKIGTGVCIALLDPRETVVLAIVDDNVPFSKAGPTHTSKVGLRSPP